MNGASCLFILIHFGSALKHTPVAASSTGEGILQPPCPRHRALAWLVAPGSPAQQSSNREWIQPCETRRFWNSLSLLLFVSLFIASPSLACLCASKQQAAPGRLQLQADPTRAKNLQFMDWC